MWPSPQGRHRSPAAVTFDAPSRTVTFTPSATLAASTVHTATVTGARDPSGNTMAPFTLSFTTGASTSACPCTIWANTAVPATVTVNDNSAVELGVRFRSATTGFITGLRFYKGASNTGTHTGSLWTNTGTRLATVTYTGETASGWQTATLSSPVPVSANTTYVASYHTNTGFYSANSPGGFASAVTRGPLTALANGTDGANGVYLYGGGGFPSNTFQSSNYWVDVVFDTSAADTTPPTVVAQAPAPGAGGVSTATAVSATFSEPVTAASVTMTLTGPSGAISGAVSYDAPSTTAKFTPAAALANSTSYTATVSGATDGSGNVMAPISWSFTTAAAPPPPPDQGPGGPVLVIKNSSPTASQFTPFAAEMLRTEGLNEFATADLSTVTATVLSQYDVVVLGSTPLTAAQVSMFTTWVTGGGNLITFRPDKQLAGLLGLTTTTTTLADGYVKVDTTTAPGAGITDQTIQFHGTADRYTLGTARAVATLYSTGTTATTNPAVSLVSVGTQGGQAAAFTYDLAQSTVYLRQGNPAWDQQERDGQAPIRSDDLYFGGASTDWVDLSKVAIPQADEQQRLLANLIGAMNLDKKPLPRFWYFPRSAKAVVVATGDDHGNGGTAGRFDQYTANSPAGCVVDNWECLRFTSYIYASTPLSNAQATAYNGNGFEVGLHTSSNCADWTPASLGRQLHDATEPMGPEIHERAGAHDQPAALHRLVRLVEPTDHRGAERHPAGHQLLLLAGHLAERPTRLHDRIRDADAVLRQDRRPDRRLPGGHPDDGRVGPELPVHPEYLAGQRDRPARLLRRVHRQRAHRQRHHVRERPTAGLGRRARGADGHRPADARLAGRPERLVVLRHHLERQHAVLHRQRRHRCQRPDRHGAQRRSGRQHPDRPHPGRQRGPVHGHHDQGRRLRDVPGRCRRLHGDVRRRRGTAAAAPAAFGAQPATFSAAIARTTGLAPLAAQAADTAPPVISAVATRPLPDGTAGFTWNTDENADATVQVGLQPDKLANFHDDTQDTTHTVVATKLQPGSTYYYRVTSADASGNTAVWPAASDPPATFVSSAGGVTDQTSAQFRTAASQSGTYVQQDQLGEVSLAPAAAAEFDTAALPTSWDQQSEVAGGKTVLKRGNLVLDGARAGTRTQFGPGRSLAFRATFQGTGTQWAGLAAGTVNDPFAMFGLRNGNLYAALSTTSLQAVQLPARLIGTDHVYRIDWSSTGFTFLVDGQRVASMSASIPLMSARARDTAADGTPLVIDWVRLSGYSGTGSRVSRVMDAQQMVTWDRLTYQADIPAGATVKISVRIGSTSTPDATWSAWTPVAANGRVVGSSRYLQYRVELSSTVPSSTPVLKDIAITNSGTPLRPPTEIQN